MFYPTTCVGLRYGPVPRMASRAVFLGSVLPHGYRRSRRIAVLSGLAPDVSAVRFRLPPFNVLFRQHARASLLRHRWDSRDGVTDSLPFVHPLSLLGCVLGPDSP